jgi:6,7-dimethyl-8-ribityllumazine synthase
MKNMIDRPTTILVIAGRFYEDITAELIKGAVAEIEEQGARHELVEVPGALEIPQVFAAACAAGLMREDGRYDGAVALGCVIRGETSHYETVANESARALMDIATRFATPVGNGILTVETSEQAWERAAVADGNKGGDAAKACLTLIEVYRKLRSANADRGPIGFGSPKT